MTGKLYRRRPRQYVVHGPVQPDNQDQIAAACNAKVEPKRIPGPGRGLTMGALFRTLEQELNVPYGWYLLERLGILRACPPAELDSEYEPAED